MGMRHPSAWMPLSIIGIHHQRGLESRRNTLPLELSAGLIAIPRLYRRGNLSVVITDCQLSPISVVAKISRGVLARTFLGWPRLMAIPWISGCTPPSTWVQVSPPSRLR